MLPQTFGKTAKSWAEPGVGGVLAVQTPAVIMRECKQREKRRKGGARSMQCRGNEERSICSFLFCSSLHPAAYISHGPVKVKHHQLLGGYLLASQCHIKTVTFLIQRERQKNNIDWRRSKQAATQLALHDLKEHYKAVSICLRHDGQN